VAPGWLELTRFRRRYVMSVETEPVAFYFDPI
jgi:hypothetical protein